MATSAGWNRTGTTVEIPGKAPSVCNTQSAPPEVETKGADRLNLAKMDASNPLSSVKPGSYYLIPAKSDLAKMDAYSPKYFLIPQTYPFLAKKDSMDLLSFSALSCTTKEVAAHDGKNHPLSRPGP